MAFTCTACLGDRTVTAPAPALAADIAASRAAPVAEGPPEKPPTWPRAYLCEPLSGQGQNVGRNPDIGKNRFAAQVAARIEQMPGLQSEKGDGDVCPDRGAEHEPGLAGKTGGQIDGHDLCSRCIGLPDDRGMRCADLAHQPRSKEGVDNDVRCLRRERVEPEQWQPHLRKRAFGIAPRPRTPRAINAHIHAGSRQKPGRDEAVAAIVAWSGQNVRRSRQRIPRQDFARDRPTRISHQRRPVEWSARDRQPVRLGHLRGRQKFNAHGKPRRSWRRVDSSGGAGQTLRSCS